MRALLSGKTTVGLHSSISEFCTGFARDCTATINQPDGSNHYRGADLSLNSEAIQCSPREALIQVYAAQPDGSGMHIHPTERIDRTNRARGEYLYGLFIENSFDALNAVRIST